MIALTWIAAWVANAFLCYFCIYKSGSTPWALLATSCAMFALLGTIVHWKLQKRNAEIKVFRKKWPEEALPSNDYYINKSVKRFALGCFFMGSVLFALPVDNMKIVEFILFAVACVVWGIMDKLTKEESNRMEEAIAEHENQRLLEHKE